MFICMMTIKTKEEIAIMAKAGSILRIVIDHVAAATKIGVPLNNLDALAEKLIRSFGAEPIFLGYKPHGAKKAYPASICASINEIIVHGIPTTYKLRAGDVVSLDFGLRYHNYCSDAAITLALPPTNAITKKLVETTKKALLMGIKQVKIGGHLGDIGEAIQTYVESRGFYIVEGLTGHGIGKELHEDPSVWNIGKHGEGVELQEGMVLAIEPMVAVGTSKIVKLTDDSYATEDGSLSAHFEHTVALTKNGLQILT